VDARPALPPRASVEHLTRPGAVLLGVPRHPRLRRDADRGRGSAADLADYRRLAARSRRRKADAAGLRSPRPPPGQLPRRRRGCGSSTGSTAASARPLFDLANLAGNAGFERSEEDWLLRPISSTDPADAARAPLRRHEGGLAAARGDVEHGVGDPPPTLGVDYAAYTAENLARFQMPRSALSRTPDIHDRAHSSRAMPRSVVIGGGIIGCSTAYHLARLTTRPTCFWSSATS
jgi:hypothetical protein